MLKALLLGAIASCMVGDPTTVWADPVATSEPASEAPAPSATQRIQAVFDEVESLIQAQNLVEALSESEAAIELARGERDAAGEAVGWKAKARVLELQDRPEDALAAWQEARGAWGRVGDGPGEIEAILAEARLRLRNPASDATSLLNEAIELMKAEKRRPIAAAGVLGAAGDSLMRVGRLKEAEGVCRSAVERLEGLAPDSLPLAVSLTNLGNVTWSQGDARGARGYHLHALAIREVKAPGSLDVAATLSNLGIAAYSQGDLAGAQEHFLRALAIDEAKAPGSLDVAATLTNLGAVAQAQGDLSGAWEYHTRARAIYEAKAPGSLDVAATLVNLGIVTYSQGDLEGAQAYWLRALVIEETKAPGSLGVATTLNNLGNVAQSQGDLAGAWGYHIRALAIREAKAPGSLDVAKSLNNLGNVAYFQGDLAGARRFFLGALTIKEAKAPGSLDVAGSLGNLGSVAEALGDAPGAREYHLRALAIEEAKAPDSLEVATRLHNLGNVAYSQGDLAGAREYLLRALAIQEAKAPGSLDMAASLDNLGVVDSSQGNLASAREHHLRALTIREAKAPESLDVATGLNNVGSVAYSQGDLASAQEYFVRALAIQETKAPRSLDVAKSLNNLGKVARDRKEFAGARESIAESWAIARRYGALVTGDEARQGFAQLHANYAFDLVRINLDLGSREAAFATLEESRSQALLQMLALRGIKDQVDDPGLWTSYSEAEYRFQQEAQRLAEASTSLDQVKADLEASRAAGEDEQTRNQEILAKAEGGREAALSEYTRLRLEVESRLAAVRNAVPALRDDPVSVEEARRILPADAVWVAFAVGEEDTAVFLVPAAAGAQITAYLIPLKTAELAAKVSAIVATIRSRPPAAKLAWQRSEAELAVAGRELYGFLFPESVRQLIDQAGRLMISPDGRLWELPFSALVMNREGEPAWLGVEKALSFQQSLSAYVREKEAHQSGGDGVLIVGNPDFGSPTTAKNRVATSGVKRKARKVSGRDIASARPVDWSRGERSYFVLDGKPPDALPGTAKEASEIARLYATEPMTGSAATEPEVRQRMPSARVIHLATHGYFHPTMPMASGVLLSAPKEELASETTDQDGVLQAYEFSGDMRLRADLVVLSACETGRGKAVHGEGLIGLTRSLQMAGARSVVATHWRIDDQASREVMVAFHRKVRGGVAKDEALRQAMAEAQLQNGTRHPYYWAAFFLSGEPRVLWSAKQK